VNIRLNSLDLKEAINDYIRKKGVNANVIQVTYSDRHGDHAQADYATILFEREASE
jgi:hypothetical protein